jgi:catechol 2,3-dioxygenase-like lactoylglutathione lyase family enzyme
LVLPVLWFGRRSHGKLARLPYREAVMQIARLDHLVLTVADIGRTCEFYARVLGMEVAQFGEGRTALRFGQQKINLHPVDNIPGLVAHRPTSGSGDLCFITETPLPEVIEHLGKCGVKIIAGPGPRAGAIGTIQSVYFRDPDQNLIEVSNY